MEAGIPSMLYRGHCPVKPENEIQEGGRQTKLYGKCFLNLSSNRQDSNGIQMTTPMFQGQTSQWCNTARPNRKWEIQDCGRQTGTVL